MKSFRGFTLVELLVTVTLVAILAMAVAPLTDPWLKSAQLEKDTAIFRAAIGEARAVAFRNSGSQFNGSAAAALCINGPFWEVFTSPNAAANCSGTKVWRGVMGEGITATYGNTFQKQLCKLQVDNKGVIHFCALTANVCPTSCSDVSENIKFKIAGYDDDEIFTNF